MTIFHRESSLVGRPDRTSPGKPSIPNNQKESVQKLFTKPPTSKKEIKENPAKQSAFGNKDYLERRQFREWLSKQPEFKKEASKYYPNLSQSQRIKKIETNIWGDSKGKWGGLIQKSSKEPERRKIEYEKELHTSRIMGDIKQKRIKTFESGLLNKLIDKK
jgi:hypothetical protein